MRFAYRNFNLILLSFVICCLFAAAQAESRQPLDVAVFSDVDTSAHYRKLSLSGEWEYKVSDDEEWQSVTLPRFFAESGQFTFRRYFTLDSAFIADDYRLFFGGVDGSCSIYLNKKIIGGHGNNTTPFVLNIAKDLLFIGDPNELMVEVDTRLDYHRSVPLVLGYRGLPLRGGALFRDVVLAARRQPFIAELSVVSEGDSQSSQAMLTVQINLKNQAISGQPAPRYGKKPELSGCMLELSEDGNTIPIWRSPVIDLGLPDASAQHFAIINQPKLWSPGSPHLYRLIATLVDQGKVLHQAELSFGLRKLNVANGSLLINDQPMRLKAIQWVEDAQIRQLSGDELEKRIDVDLLAIQAAGANAVRVFAGSPPQHLLETCDKLGLAVLVEIPVVNVPPALFDDQGLINNAMAALTDLIKGYQEHPSIIAWGIGSGYDANDPRTEKWVRRLYENAKQLDDRPVYASIRASARSKAGLPVDLLILDIPSDELERFSSRNRPSLSPTAATIFQVTALLPLSEHPKLAERNQAYLLKNGVHEILENKQTAGVIVAPLRDWLGNTPHTFWGPRHQANLFLAGMLDASGNKRAAYDCVSALFKGTPPPNILQTDILVEEPILFQVTSLALVVIVLVIYNRDRRLRLYLRRLFFYPHGFYMDLNENRQVSPFLTGAMGIATFLIISIFAASFAYFLRFNSYFDEMLTWLFAHPATKFRVLWLIWHPAAFLPAFVFLLVVIAALQVMLLKVITFIQGRYLRLGQLTAFVLWVPANMLLSLPLAIIFYRALGKPNLVIPSLIYLGAMVLWFAVRTFRGTKVILQITIWKTMLLYLIAILLLVFTVGAYLESSRSITAYFDYYRHLLGW